MSLSRVPACPSLRLALTPHSVVRLGETCPLSPYSIVITSSRVTTDAFDVANIMLLLVSCIVRHGRDGNVNININISNPHDGRHVRGAVPESTRPGRWGGHSPFCSGKREAGTAGTADKWITLTCSCKQFGIALCFATSWRLMTQHGGGVGTKPW